MTTPLRGRPGQDDYWPTRWATIERRVERGVPLDFRRDDLTKTFENKADPQTVRRLYRFVTSQGTPPVWCEDRLVGDPMNVGLEDEEGAPFRATRASVEHAFMAHLVQKAGEHARPLAGVADVVEIGGGFGGLALKIFETLEPKSYELVDTGALLKIQTAFLDRNGYRDELVIASRPNEFFASARAYDLAIATRCFGEMPAVTARDYVQALHRRLRPLGLLMVVSWRQKVSRWTDLGLEALPWSLQDVRDWPRDIDPNPMKLGFFVK